MKHLILLRNFLNLFFDKSFFYQKEEQIMRSGSDFIFESVDLLYNSLNETRLKRVKSYIKSTEWLENKGATIH